MVDKSDRVLVIWNGKKMGGTYATYQYAKRKNKPITLFMLEDILTLVDEDDEIVDDGGKSFIDEIVWLNKKDIAFMKKNQKKYRKLKRKIP